MISEKMKGFVAGSSAIRAMFEEGKRMAAEFGADHVYDFSLGNPNVPAPQAVKDAILDITENEDPVMLHGYMNNSGYEDVRQTIAEHLNKNFHTSFSATECHFKDTLKPGRRGRHNLTVLRRVPLLRRQLRRRAR